MCIRIYIYDPVIYVHIKAVVSSNIFCLFFFTICIGLLHLTRPDDSALEATNGAESIRSGVLNALYPWGQCHVPMYRIYQMDVTHWMLYKFKQSTDPPFAHICTKYAPKFVIRLDSMLNKFATSSKALRDFKPSLSLPLHCFQRADLSITAVTWQHLQHTTVLLQLWSARFKVWFIKPQWSEGVPKERVYLDASSNLEGWLVLVMVLVFWDAEP